MKYQIRAVVIVALVGFFCRISNAEQLEALASYDFESKREAADWDGGEVDDGALFVEVEGGVNRFNGTRSLLEPELRIPEDEDESLHVRFTILSFENVEEGDDLQASARIFLAPEPLPKFTEPYVLPQALTLYIDYDSHKDIKILLYRKNGGKGFGKILYSGTLRRSELPLTVDVFMSQQYYRVLFDKDVLSDSGSLSGFHEFPMELWSEPIRFGMRSVNQVDGVRARIGYDDFTATINQGLRK